MKPIELQMEKQGHYQMTHEEKGLLAYADSLKNKELAAKQKTNTFKDTETLYNEEGN